MLSIKLKGKHNLYNILAASTISKLYGINSSNIINTIKKFNPLPHRINFVEKIDGITFINDSKSTNIASTIAAINCFKNINLILGGEYKGSININEITKKIIDNKNIKNIIVYGAVSSELRKHLGYNTNIQYFNIFENAVNASIKISEINDYVLLSPAFSSFDQFIDYKERGNVFVKIIKDYNRDK